jgi:hypothetical protein
MAPQRHLIVKMIFPKTGLVIKVLIILRLATKTWICQIRARRKWLSKMRCLTFTLTYENQRTTAYLTCSSNLKLKKASMTMFWHSRRLNQSKLQTRPAAIIQTTNTTTVRSIMPTINRSILQICPLGKSRVTRNQSAELQVGPMRSTKLFRLPDSKRLS